MTIWYLTFIMQQPTPLDDAAENKSYREVEAEKCLNVSFKFKECS